MLKRDNLEYFPLVALLSLGMFLAVPANPQVSGAIMLGIVTDSQNAALPNVEVKARNVATGVAVTTLTNGAGSYEFPALDSGTYDISASGKGMATYSRPGVQLVLQQRLRLDIVMTLASVRQTVEVTDQPALVDTDSASASHLVTGQTVDSAPILGRNPQLVTRLVAGSNPTLATDGFAGPNSTFAPTDISFNGTPAAGGLVLVDGVADQYGTGAMAYTPSTYAVQEVRVQSFALSAEYGQYAGSVTSFETKPGTNDLHGAAWFYHTGESFNANSFFSNKVGQPRTENRRTQGGFVMGGPVYIPHVYNGRNRTFWFFDFEDERDRVGTTFLNTVPTPLQRNGDFSQSFASNGQLIQIYNPFTTRFNASNVLVRDPFPNNVIPASLINPVSANLLKYIPLPNLPGIANNDQYNFGFKHTDNNYRMRFDHRFDDKNSISASYGWLPLDIEYQGALQTFVSGYHNQSWDKLFTLSYVHIFSPTMIFNLRTGLQAYNQVITPLVAGAAFQSLGFSSTFLSEAQGGNVFPQISSSDMTSIGYPLQGVSYVNPDVRAAFTKIVNRHSIDFGYEFRPGRVFTFNANGQAGTFAFNRDWTQGPTASAASATAGYGFATLLLGTPSSGSLNMNSNVAAQTLYHALYVEDNWRVTSKLTLNLGLRYDYQTPLTERYNRLNRGFDFNVANPIAQQAQTAYARNPIPQLASLPVNGGLLFTGVNGQSRYNYNPIHDNFAPRLGAAYQITPRTVVRAGIGWFYLPYVDARATTVSSGAPPLSQAGFSSTTVMQTSLNGLPVNSLTNPFPQGVVQPVGSSLGLTTLLGQAVSASDVNVKRGLSEEFQVSLQRQIPGKILLDLAYVGSRVQNLTVDRPMDTLSPQYFPLADQLSQQVTNPFFGLIATGPLSTATVARSQLLLPYPEFASITDGFAPVGHIWYNALQITASRRFDKGVELTAAYTFSKNIDEMRFRNQYQPIERDIAQIDRPQRLVVSALWKLPFGKGQSFGSSAPRALVYLFGDWEIDPIVTFQSGQLAGPWTNAIAIRPLQAVDKTLGKWFDTGAFAPQPAFTLPTLSTYNPNIRGQGLHNLDVSISKNFPIREKVSFRLMVQLYNALNTPQFGTPNVTVTSPAFGTVTTQANNPRWIMLGGALHF